MSRLLIRNGCVLHTRPTPRSVTGVDVLVEDGLITRIGRDLAAGPDTDLLDATWHIVAPGFVDTHRHGWQSLLRGIAPDAGFGDYMQQVNAEYGAAYTPAHLALAAELTGMECLDAGITTVYDYAHAMWTPEHADAQVAGLRASGVRAVLGYGRPVFGPRIDADDVRRVRAALSDDDALVTMSLAPLGPSYAPADEVLADWRLAIELDLPISVHVSAGPVAHAPIAALQELGVLTPRTLYVHGNTLPDAELALIRDSGGALSITPAIEARMELGPPVLPRARRLGVPAGLGVDVVTSGPGDPFCVLRAAQVTADVAGDHVAVADLVALGTTGGAAALGMTGRFGSLEVGAAADIVLLRTDTVGAAGGHDPFAALLAAHPGVVDTVLVAGRVVKRDGALTGGRVGAVVAAAQYSARRLARTG